jgi:hypothetical protein
MEYSTVYNYRLLTGVGEIKILTLQTKEEILKTCPGYLQHVLPVGLLEPAPAHIPELAAPDDRLDGDVAGIQLLGKLPYSLHSKRINYGLHVLRGEGGIFLTPARSFIPAVDKIGTTLRIFTSYFHAFSRFENNY